MTSTNTDDLSFVLYTNEHGSQHRGRLIIKFAHDSVTVSPPSNDDPHRGPVGSDFIVSHRRRLVRGMKSHGPESCGNQRPGCRGCGQFEIP